jgi:hypothetical protein
MGNPKGADVKPPRGSYLLGGSYTIVNLKVTSESVIPAPIFIGINSSRTTEGRRSEQSERAHPEAPNNTGLRPGRE